MSNERDIALATGNSVFSWLSKEKGYQVSLFDFKNLGVNVAVGARVPKESKNKADIVKKILQRAANKAVMIKPIEEGSSKNTFLVHDADSFDYAQIDSDFLVEEWINGYEFSVLCLGSTAVGAVEMVTTEGFFDEKAKYVDGVTEYFSPPKHISNSSNEYEELLQTATKIHSYLGCANISRQDFIFSKLDKRFYFLEVNTHPGMTSHSLAPLIAKNCAGMSPRELVCFLVENAKYGC